MSPSAYWPAEISSTNGKATQRFPLNGPQDDQLSPWISNFLGQGVPGCGCCGSACPPCCDPPLCGRAILPVAGGWSGAGLVGDGGGSSGTALTGPVPNMSADMPTLAVITATLDVRLTFMMSRSSAPRCWG
jgi:hypothetical protein